jgi:glutathione S-transferase
VATGSLRLIGHDMTLRIYGSFRSRTRRVIWAALELGLPFDHHHHASTDPILKQPEFLAVNPLGRIPVIRDGDLTLSESLAINLHLAKHHDSGPERRLYPDALEAQLWQWSFFAASDLDPWVGQFGSHTAWRPEAEREPLLARTAEAALERAFGHLETALSASPVLVGDGFSIADLNVASVLLPLSLLHHSFAAWPHLDAWLRAAVGRPAALATLQYP